MTLRVIENIQKYGLHFNIENREKKSSEFYVKTTILIIYG